MLRHVGPRRPPESSDFGSGFVLPGPGTDRAHLFFAHVNATGATVSTKRIGETQDGIVTFTNLIRTAPNEIVFAGKLASDATIADAPLGTDTLFVGRRRLSHLE